MDCRIQKEEGVVKRWCKYGAGLQIKLLSWTTAFDPHSFSPRDYMFSTGCNPPPPSISRTICHQKGQSIAHSPLVHNANFIDAKDASLLSTRNKSMIPAQPGKESNHPRGSRHRSGTEFSAPVCLTSRKKRKSFPAISREAACRRQPAGSLPPLRGRRVQFRSWTPTARLVAGGRMPMRGHLFTAPRRVGEGLGRSSGLLVLKSVEVA